LFTEEQDHNSLTIDELAVVNAGDSTEKV